MSGVRSRWLLLPTYWAWFWLFGRAVDPSTHLYLILYLVFWLSLFGLLIWGMWKMIDIGDGY